MARNRKNQPGLLFSPALKVSLICLPIVVCCVGYVWQKKQISELSQQIRHEESELAGCRDKNEKMKKQLASLLSPVSLEMRAKELNLGLVQPDPAKIWRLPEPAAESTMRVSVTTQFAGGKSAALETP